MTYISNHLWKTIEMALRAFGAEPQGTTAFARYWNAVGAVEDYAAVAETPAERTLAELMRLVLIRQLRKGAPNDALHPDARGVEEFLDSPPRRTARR